MNQPVTPLTVVQTIDIDCPVARAFDFMNDAKRWLPWAMPQVKSVQPLPFGQWLVRTSNGVMKLRPRYNATCGILDYELVNPMAGAWYIPGRMVATPTGCHLAITLVKPARLPLKKFESRMAYVTEGMSQLKQVLEQR